MRHKVSKKKFNRHGGARGGLEYSLIVSLLDKKSISTTLPKAKFLRPKVERLVTKAKNGDSLTNRRYLLKRLRNNKTIVNKLLAEYSVKYKNVNGGYTRIQRTSLRSGDNTQMATISFIEPKDLAKPATTKQTKESTTKKAKKTDTNKTSKATTKVKAKKAK